PSISSSVEQLFSSSKATIYDAQCSMTATTASKTIVVKERLKRGLSKTIDYLKFMNI
ncbi:hypothetical protein K439DRAFT_1317797, partial [Ramaria rubella]